MLLFALIELLPSLNKITFSKEMLPIGGLLSGFFGGLSGHQGALRSAFLLKTNLQPEQYIATGILIATVVDITRIFVYGSRYAIEVNAYLVTAIIAAFAGAFFGSKFIKKVTIKPIRIFVFIMFVIIAIGVGTGIL